MVSTEYIRQQIGHFRDGIAAYGLGDLYEDELAVFEECLAYCGGYDPQERLPDLGQWTVIEPVDVRDNEPPCVVAQWVNAPQEAIDGWVCDREPDAQLWFVDLGGLFNWWAASDVRRWYPLPGGER